MTTINSNMRAACLTLGLLSAVCACELKQSASKADKAPTEPSAKSLALTEAQVPPHLRAQFWTPGNLAAVDESMRVGTDVVDVEYLLVADTRNHAVRRVEPATGLTTTIMGTLGVAGSGANQLNKPAAVAGGGMPDMVFVADTGNHVVRYLHEVYDYTTDTMKKQVDVLAGTPGQQGYENAGAPLFNSPQGVCIGKLGYGFLGIGAGSIRPPETIYVADTGNGVIRRVHIADGRVELVAGTPGVQGYADASSGSQAKFNRPTGLVAHGNYLYVADTGNRVIRRIDVSANGSNAVTTFAGVPQQYGHRDGALEQALFAQPVSLSFDWNLGLIVSDRASHTLRRININTHESTTPVVTTIAGTPWQHGSSDGDQATSRFRAPSGAASINGVIYSIDAGNNLVRAVRTSSAGSSVSTLTGKRIAGKSDGWPESFTIGQPKTVACDGHRLFIDGNGVHAVQVDEATGTGRARGVASSAWSNFVHGNNALYRILFYQIEKLDLATGQRSIFAGVNDGDNEGFYGMLPTPDGFYAGFSFNDFTIHKLSYTGELQEAWYGMSHETAFLPSGPIAYDGSSAYSGSASGLRKTDLTVRPITYVDLPLSLGTDTLLGLAVADGYAYFTTDGRQDPALRNVVRRLNLTSGEVSVFAGTQGQVDAPFENPHGICASGNYLYVADTANGEIKRVQLSNGAVSTLNILRAQ